jgi:O-antigen ligase
MKPEKKSAGNEIYALAFGLFLGLAFWKFGNPVILDYKIIPPATPSEFWHDAWPTHWANWIFLPFALAGALVAFNSKPRWTARRWLWLLPLLWLGWQLVSATQTVDTDLTAATLWQFFGCVACYFVGALILNRENAVRWLLAGVLATFAFCLVRAVDQRLVEFPQSHQMLVEGERDAWTNVPPEMLLEMKREQVVITTNGVDVANPVVLAKFAKGRVMGTLVYPNALAGAVLLLMPLALTLAFGTKKLRPAIRVIVIVLTCFLGGTGFFWTGSKLGWLIAMGMGGLYLLRLNWPARLKIAALAIVAILGLGIFAVRFHNYFAAGATSAGARLDYWRAAVQTTAKNPFVGTGPGTFQRPYAQIKSPDAEMARLAHNDYLEQFSDSGIPGGIFYSAWIALALISIGRTIWKSKNNLPQPGRGRLVRAGESSELAGELPALQFAIFIGLLGWFVQGVGEFSLYIPALAWTAFTLLGCSLALTGNQFDKNPSAG